MLRRSIRGPGQGTLLWRLSYLEPVIALFHDVIAYRIDWWTEWEMIGMIYDGEGMVGVTVIINQSFNLKCSALSISYYVISVKNSEGTPHGSPERSS